MRLKDTTDPQAHMGSRTLLRGPGSGDAFDLVSGLRFHIVGMNFAEVGTEWDSAGRSESDYLHHVELVLSGHRQVVRGDRILDLDPGHIYFLPGNTPVVRRCRERCRLLYIKFRCEWLPGVDPLLGWSERRHVAVGTFNAADWREWQEPGWTPDANRLLRLHAQLEEWMSMVLPDLESLIRRHLDTHARFMPVFNLIESRLGADLRVADLARAHGTTPEAFSMAFIRYVGIGPKEYLSRRVNQAAIQLVLNTKLTLKEIAHRLQFSDEFYFSRFFRKLNGAPPSHYRKKFQKTRSASSPAVVKTSTGFFMV